MLRPLLAIFRKLSMVFRHARENRTDEMGKRVK